MVTANTKYILKHFSGQAIIMNVHLLKSAIHKKIAPSESSLPKGRLSNWIVPSSSFGNVFDTLGYCKWVEDVLPHYKEDLEQIKIYDVVYTSLFMFTMMTTCFTLFVSFGVNMPILFPLLLVRCPYNFGTYGWLEVFQFMVCFFDEVVHSTKELTPMDTCQKSSLHKSCLYLFSTFYELSKVDLYSMIG